MWSESAGSRVLPRFGTEVVRRGAVLAVAYWVLALAPASWQALLAELGVDSDHWGQLHAADDGKSAEQSRKTPALSNAVYEQLNKAQELSEAGDINGALAVLNGLRDSRRTKLNSYELANLYNFYAFIYFQRERYDQAIQAYRKVLSQANLPLAMEVSTLYSLAQLYFVVEDYPKAIQSLNSWFKLAENPQPEAHVLLAQAYYQTKNYNKSLREIERAMSIARARGKAPRENWYLLMRVLYHEKGNMKKVAWVLEQLVRGWPKKEYLTQLSGVQGELRNEKRQLVAMETAYTAGMLSSEQELLNMAYLYLGTDTPYKAAKVLEAGLDQRSIARSARNYALLGDALRAAQELKRAIPALEQAAELADDGEPWARLAGIYLDREEFGKAAQAAGTALNKGRLRRPDSTRVVLGMALFNMDRMDRAREAFQRAARDERSRKVAEDWIKYLESEIARRESLRDGLS